MAHNTRPEHKINLDNLPQMNFGQPRSASSTNANSPNEPPAASGLRYPLGNSLAGTGSMGLVNRTGAGSPSKDFGSRLFSKRAREIQAQEGISPQIWGPPTTNSGHSTPLRETIPESPSNDTFPDFDQSANDFSSAAPSAGRRLRAGTVPSRFPPVGSNSSSTSNGQNTQPLLHPKTSRPSPSSSPLQGGAYGSVGESSANSAGPNASQRSLLSRLRAGSLPQRAGMLNSSQSPFGPSYFSNGWSGGRERASTLQSIRSNDDPSSPVQSSRDSFAEGDVKTLDYLGLVDNPRSARAALESGMMGGSQPPLVHPTIADLAALNAYNRTANRFRSYSVNAKERYMDGEDDDLAQLDEYGNIYGSTLTPNSDITAAQALAVQEAVRQHNLDVQAFANLASVNRPRARTAGVLDAPSSRLLRNYLPTPSRLADSSITAADLEGHEGLDYNTLTDAVEQMNLEHRQPLDSTLENPTRALWLGNIPPSTTVSSLNVIFSVYGPIESTRVLTHKSCGFVNFDKLESAILAKAELNEREIFPGAGPVRIGYAKVPSNTATPGAAGSFQSPSPDPFAKDHSSESLGAGLRPENINAVTAAAALATPNLRDMRGEIFAIVQELGASPEEQARITVGVEQAISYDLYHPEIPPIPEPSHNRVHDAPRLRDIRKRIDNQSVTQPEIENMAMEMLPEIAELASDYLGNTVVQKLFENCSEGVKEAMLAEISPHLSEIGVHKNGTWAAQKIIDTARTPAQMEMIVDALRPYATALFLDQYGNYVMQCCLRFQSPHNDFIFDAMLQRLWDVAQGRFGARAMRACLESHYATRDQQRMMAAAIALHSVQLATNANGALLLTWFLDTCTFPRRRAVLAPRLIPHLVHLCTHKVAYLTVLKIVNQRSESEAREAVLNALFFSPNDSTLQDILSDQTCGATFIFKVLTTPFLDEKIRPQVLENVRSVLLRLKAQPQQGYKRLMDEVGLSSRHGGASASREASQTRSSSRGPAAHTRLAHLETQAPFSRQGYQMQPQPMDHLMGSGLQRSTSIESNGFDPYAPNGLMTPAYTHSPAMSNISPVTPQQMQYQQAMLQQQAAAAAGAQRPNGFYQPGNVPMNGYGSPGPQMMESYGRPGINGPPMPAPGMGQPSGFPPSGYNAQMGMGGFQYPMGYYPPQQGQVGGQRRGRVR